RVQVLRRRFRQVSLMNGDVMLNGALWVCSGLAFMPLRNQLEIPITIDASRPRMVMRTTGGISVVAFQRAKKTMWRVVALPEVRAFGNPCKVKSARRTGAGTSMENNEDVYAQDRMV